MFSLCILDQLNVSENSFHILTNLGNDSIFFSTFIIKLRWRHDFPFNLSLHRSQQNLKLLRVSAQIPLQRLKKAFNYFDSVVTCASTGLCYYKWDWVSYKHIWTDDSNLFCAWLILIIFETYCVERVLQEMQFRLKKSIEFFAITIKPT